MLEGRHQVHLPLMLLLLPSPLCFFCVLLFLPFARRHASTSCFCFLPIMLRHPPLHASTSSFRSRAVCFFLLFFRPYITFILLRPFVALKPIQQNHELLGGFDQGRGGLGRGKYSE